MFSDPDKNLRAFGIRGNDVVADLGAGTGFYAVAAGRLASAGKVYAVEVQRDYLSKIRHKALEARLSNVEAIWGDVERPGGTKLRDGAVDKVIASNLLFQVENKEGFIAEVKRILKPGGEVLLIDWTSSPAMPHKSAVISKEKAREMFERKNFTLLRELNAGAHHYGMILVKR
jgi:ubiquinone/menaquinone biosynthesis C-methylase UbiE